MIGVRDNERKYLINEACISYSLGIYPIKSNNAENVDKIPFMSPTLQ